MRKFLLGTTALAAASMVAGGLAQAAEEPIAVGLGGYYRAAMGVVDEDDGVGQPGQNQNNVVFSQDIEISVSGSTTLDNGITVGVSMQLEGNANDNTSSTLDERFLFFRGNFGQIRLGATESARQEFTNFAPSGAYNFGVNTPFFLIADQGIGLGNFTIRTYDDGLGVEDSLKLVYFTPTFNGFRIGASYAPDDADTGSYGGNAPDAAGGMRDQTSVAAEFSNDFGDFNIRVAAGYERYTLEACTAIGGQNNCVNDPESIHFGGTVSFGAFSVGGGWLQGDLVSRAGGGAAATLGAGLERTDWDIGASWWSGPWGVGVLWGHAEIEAGGSGEAVTTGGGEHEVDMYAINGTYILGPGIDLEAQIDFGEFDTNASSGAATILANDNDWTTFHVGTAITF